MNPYVIEALGQAIERFGAQVGAGDFEKAEDYAITAFGLAAMFSDPFDAAEAAS